MITALCAVIMTSVGCQNNENIESGLENPEINVGENVDNTQQGDDKEPEKPVEDNKESEKPAEDNKEPEKPVEDNKEPEKPVEDNKEPEKPVEDNKEPEKPVEDDDEFENKSEAYLELEKMVNDIVESAKVEINVPFTMEITADSSSTYVGLKSEEYEKNVEIGVAYESMMMPSNRSICLLRLKDGADLATIKQNVYDNCNPRKWVCMSAEYVYVVGKDNYVMLVMASQDECKDLAKAFESKVGKDDNILEKIGEEPWDGGVDADVIF